jgi:type IV secretory pathway component VirB8
MKDYNENQVMLRGDHKQERGGKRRILRRWIWLIYFLYKNEYRLFKPVEITTRRELRRKMGVMSQF